MFLTSSQLLCAAAQAPCGGLLNLSVCVHPHMKLLKSSHHDENNQIWHQNAVLVPPCAEMKSNVRKLRHPALKLSVSIIVRFALKIHDTRRLWASIRVNFEVSENRNMWRRSAGNALSINRITIRLCHRVWECDSQSSVNQRKPWAQQESSPTAAYSLQLSPSN